MAGLVDRIELLLKDHSRRTKPASSFNDEVDSEKDVVNVVKVFISNSREVASKQRHASAVKVHDLIVTARCSRLGKRTMIGRD